MMLCVVLAMTPRVRFRRLPTLISIAALSLNLVRMVLLAVYFTTTWMDLYVLVSQDPRFVSRADVHTSVAATALSVPVTMLILAALCVQAWSMLRLWLVLWKLPACLVSAGLVVVTVTFSIMTTIIQANVVLYPGVQPDIPVWVRMAYLSCITASICWFCFLFNIRLVMHMWTNRSILPSLKGLKAMDVLVITNGILMFVPGKSRLSFCFSSRVLDSAADLLPPHSRLRRPRVLRLGPLRIRLHDPDLGHPRPPARHPRRAAPRQPGLVRQQPARGRLAQQHRRHGLVRLARRHVGRHGHQHRQAPASLERPRQCREGYRWGP